MKIPQDSQPDGININFINSLTLHMLNNNNEEIFRYLSLAKNKETEKGTHKYFYTKVGNKIHGSLEFADTIILTCLLDHKT